LYGSTWFVETNESPISKDFYLVIQGAWCVELAELDAFRRAEETAQKTANSRQTDKFRAPYDRLPRSYRRECVLAGTTNEHAYLRDASGARRFLPARVEGEVYLDRIGDLRDQLWAEAVHLFEAGFAWWELPPEAKDEQEDRYIPDSWEGRISRWLTRNMAGDRERIYPERLRWGDDITQVTTDEILQWCMAMDPGKHGKPEQMRVAAAMKRLGWESKRQVADGVRERRWVRASVAVEEEGDDGVPF
jgi:predicted P-loop ATPase